jgi:cysteine desulfurase
MLKVEGFSADSGSACTAMDLAPSHVLSAMGLPTQGNVRVAIHPDTTAVDVSAFADKLLKAVEKMQGQLTR